MKRAIFLVVLVFLFSFASSAEYQLKSASELKVGDIIIDSQGNEIVVKSVVGPGKMNSEFVYEKSKPLNEVLWEKISGRSLPEPVVSGGSSPKGLSLGDSGTGIKVQEGSEFNLPNAHEEQKKSFWSKLKFWGRA